MVEDMPKKGGQNFCYKTDSEDMAEDMVWNRHHPRPKIWGAVPIHVADCRCPAQPGGCPSLVIRAGL